MDAEPILDGLEAVTKRWTKQRKAEERSARAVERRDSMWAPRPTTLREACIAVMEQSWNQASDDGRLPTHWRQVFYVARPLVGALTGAVLKDSYFKKLLEEHVEEHRLDWDIVRGARGVFKEPHGGPAIAMSTLTVRRYLSRSVDLALPHLDDRYPTVGAGNRFGAVLICEKEGFDELLQAAHIPERYDLALMSTKGISALAARALARQAGVPCFTLHDFDKNGFVMAAGFPEATDIGLRLTDAQEWQLTPEAQQHSNPWATYTNLLKNGATEQEATFIANGQRVELNVLTGPQFIAFVEQKLQQHGVPKVVPDADTLGDSWRRAKLVHRINTLIDESQQTLGADLPPPPSDLAEQLDAQLEADPSVPWDDIIATLTGPSGGSPT